MLVTLILAALSFVYALAFLTGGMGNVQYYYVLSGDTRVDRINAKGFYDATQSFTDTLVILSIVFIILVALMYFTACNTRRNYYITNYIAIGATVILALVVVIYSIICISNIMNLFYNDIAWVAGSNGGNNYADKLNSEYPIDKSPLNFILGYILYFIILVDVVALVLNVVWKIKLMQGEKALLKAGLEKEVA